MVAAAKVKRAEGRMKAGRPYTDALYDVMTRVYNELKNHVKALSESRYVELLAPRPIKNVGIVVVSSDRGLCGSYNTSVIKQAFQLERAIKEKGLTPKFFLVGNKVINAFNRYSNSEVLGKLGDCTAAPQVEHANEIAEVMTKAFVDGEVDSIEVLSTDFISMISYKIHLTSVIPIKGKLKEHQPVIDPSQGYVTEQVHEPSKEVKPELLLEPDPVETLDQLLPMYMSNVLYLLLLEACASELAARMTAMSNATKNAGDMIDRLTLDYNKARQAAITQELLEVVAGAEALG